MLEAYRPRARCGLGIVGFDASYESLILLIGEIGIHREVVAYAVT